MDALVRTGARVLALAGRLAPSIVEPEAAALAAIARPGDVALDVGAKHGLYTAVLAAAVGPSGVVVAFEPLPGPRRVLRSMRRLVGAGAVRIVAAAVADRPGSGTMALPVRRGLPVPGRAFLRDRARDLGSNREFSRHTERATRVVTIDEWVEAAGIDRVDVLKVDAEGAEGLVLDGASTTLRRWAPTLLLELEDRHLERTGTSAAMVLERLRALGYRAAVLDGDGWTEAAALRPDRRNHLLVARPDVLTHLGLTRAGLAPAT